MKIVIDSGIPYINGVLEPWARVVYRDAIGRADIADADAMIVRTRTRCDRALLEGSRVRLVASATAGFDHIDLDYCRAAGIEAAWAPGSNARAVLQWVAAALSHVFFRAREKTCDRAIDNGQLTIDNFGAHVAAKPIVNCPLSTVNSTKLGIVGVGAVGSLVAEYAAAWGFEVLLCDPPKANDASISCEPPSSAASPHRYALGGATETFHSLDFVAAHADIITFHTPLTHTGEDATFHLADDEFFKKLKANALIINASRGEVIDTQALLRSKNACCIDTWEGEPNISRALLDRALLGTPHIAGYSVQGKANATAAAVQAVARRFDLPLDGWYPEGIAPPAPHPIGWNEMRTTIKQHFDIAAQSLLLKASPADFEKIRNNYDYRQEYF